MAFLLTALAFVWCGIASAQSTSDRVYIGVQGIAGAEADNRPGEVAQRAVIANLSARPIHLGGGTMLTLGAGFSNTLIDFDAGAAFPGEPAQRHLTAIDARIGLIQRLNEHWTLIAVAVPGIRSDLSRRLDGDAFQLAGVALLAYTFPGYPRLTLSLGAIAQTHAALIPVLPIVTVNYLSDRFMLEAGAGGVVALVRAGTRVEAGLFASFDASFYSIDPAATGTTTAARYLRMTTIAAGPQVSFRPVDDVWAHVRAGYTITRVMRLSDEDRRTIAGLETDPSGAFMLQIGVSYGAHPPLQNGTAPAR